MAAEGAKMDQKAHERTYESFISLFKIGTAITIVITAVVVLLIAN